MAATMCACVLHLALLAALLVPVEQLWPARALPIFRRGWRTDAAHFFLDPLIVKPVALALIALMDRAAAALPRPTQPVILQALEVFLLMELAEYALHRAQHAVPLLWRFHRVHHSTTEMGFLAAHRQHPVESVMMIVVAAVPGVLVGFSFRGVAGVLLLQKLYTAFLHANCAAGFGRMGRFIASPQFHHWHHAQDAEAIDTNFAATLAFLDVIFGTFHLPEGRWPVSLGADSRVPDTWIAQLWHPLSTLTARRGDDVQYPETSAACFPWGPARLAWGMVTSVMGGRAGRMRFLRSHRRRRTFRATEWGCAGRGDRQRVGCGRWCSRGCCCPSWTGRRAPPVPRPRPRC